MRLGVSRESTDRAVYRQGLRRLDNTGEELPNEDQKKRAVGSGFGVMKVLHMDWAGVRR